MVPASVIFTSVKLSRIEIERSLTIDSLIAGGMPACKRGQHGLQLIDELQRVGAGLTPDADHLAATRDPTQLACSGESTPATTLATSPSRTGAPLR